MQRTAGTLAIVIYLASFGTAEAGLFGPDNYDECILKGMRGVVSDVAARAIQDACRNKFPETQPESRRDSRPEPTQQAVVPNALAEEQLEKLQVRMCRLAENNAAISCQIYNGNADVTVTEIEVAITTEDYAGESRSTTYVGVPSESASARSGRQQNIRPGKNGFLALNVAVPGKTNWYLTIAGAKGL